MGAPYITGKGFGILAGSWSQSGDQQGSTVALDLSDDDVETSWLVVVKAQTSQGEFILGAVRTRSPAAGDPKARTILLAWHPGVIKWGFDFFGPMGATCRPSFSTDKCACGGAAFGISPTNGSRVERRFWDMPPPPIVPAVQGVIVNAPATLIGLYGFTDPATPAGFFGFVDKNVNVINGDPFRLAPVPFAPGATLAFTFEPDGVSFASGIRWVLSSTSNLVTLLGAGGGIFQGGRI